MSLKAVLIFLFITVNFLFAARTPLTSSVKSEGSTYTVTVVFSTTLPREQFMEVLFTYDHTKQYVKQPNLTISLVKEEPRYNIIKYHYNYLVSKMDMAIENTISPDYNHFIFNQKSYYRSNKLIPNMISSGGRYDILKVENGEAIVKYTQYGTMDQKVGTVFSKVIEMESVGFIKSLLKYVRTLEQQRSVAVR